MCRGCVHLEMCDNLHSFSCRRKITFYDGMVTMASIMRVDWHRRSAVKKLHTRRGRAKMNEQNRTVVEAVTQRFISIIQRGWPLKGGAHEKLPLNNKLGENEMHVRSIHEEKTMSSDFAFRDYEPLPFYFTWRCVHICIFMFVTSNLNAKIASVGHHSLLFVIYFSLRVRYYAEFKNDLFDVLSVILWQRRITRIKKHVNEMLNGRNKKKTASSPINYIQNTKRQ